MTVENRYSQFTSPAQRLCYDITSHAVVNGFSRRHPDITALIKDVLTHVNRAAEDADYHRRLLRLLNPGNYVQTNDGYPYIAASDKQSRQPGSWREAPLSPLTVVCVLVPHIRQDATSLTIGDTGLTVYEPNGSILIKVADMDINPDRPTGTDLSVIDSFVFGLTGLSSQLVCNYETKRLRMRCEPDGSWTISESIRKRHYANN